MAPTSTLPTTLAADLHAIADVINATPALADGGRYPEFRYSITIIADTATAVHAAAAINDSRVFRDEVTGQTYTQVVHGLVTLTYTHVPTANFTPVDVTGQDQAVHAS